MGAHAETYCVNHLFHAVQDLYLAQNPSHCEKELLWVLVRGLDHHPFAHGKRLGITEDQVYLILVVINKFLKQMHITGLGNFVSQMINSC